MLLDSEAQQASRTKDDKLGTHALAIISLLYNRVIAGAAAAVRNRTGLSVTEAKIVFHIGAGGSTTANRLVRHVGLDKAAISRGINRLVQLGIIRSERDPRNGVRNLLSLTDAGRTACAEVTHFTFARESYLLSALDDGEQRQFLESLRKILTMVDATNTLVEQGEFWP